MFHRIKFIVIIKVEFNEMLTYNGWCLLIGRGGGEDFIETRKDWVYLSPT